MINLTNLTSHIRETIPIKLIVTSALSIGAGGSTGSLADKAIVRNARGQMIIPGSHLKGRLRHECEKIGTSLGWEIYYAPLPAFLCPDTSTCAQYKLDGYRGFHCPISQIFGDPFLPSRIIVDDLICELGETEEVIRPGVTINRYLHTAEDRKLYYTETSPVAAELEFIGQIHITKSAPLYTKALLISALRQIKNLGGSKSAGMGWVKWYIDNLEESDSSWSELG
ncbi:MAG: RAMP superfamily CRISPR-associated protein [Pseudanabaenaceae cyanobacterium]